MLDKMGYIVEVVYYFLVNVIKLPLVSLITIVVAVKETISFVSGVLPDGVMIRVLASGFS